jgi:UDP-glucose-4-epimerase GalE
MKILVTGGAGYIGSHTVRLLTQAGHRVTIFDNFVTGHWEMASGYQLVEASLGDQAALGRALKGMDVVIHFAASAYVGESVSNPRKYFDNNVTDGLVLLNAVLDSGVRKFVLSSSCAVYGVPPTLPIHEQMPCRPTNPYGESKLFMEKALEAYDIAYGLRSIRLRYFNAAGADPGGLIGEVHDPETHLIPLALEVAAGLRDHIEVYGTDYETEDGTCIRDFTHVMDLARAHVQAVRYLGSGGECCAVNLGTGRGHTVAEVISSVERITGRTVKVIMAPRRAGDPPVLVADSSKAERVLNWRARHSLDDMVDSAWRWINSDAYRAMKERNAQNSRTLRTMRAAANVRSA